MPVLKVWKRVGMTSPDYSAWPVVGDVQARLNATGIVLRGVSGDAAGGADTARIQAAIDEVEAEVGRRTLRQFVADPPGSPTTRSYDGSGTARLEIDEFVEMDGVSVVGLTGDTGYALADVSAIVEQGKPMWALTRLVGGTAVFPAVESIFPLGAVFPVGRQNIVVTARFGYAESIPADLWHHVCGEMARRVAVEAIFQAGGRLQTQKAGDEAQTFTLGDIDALGWQEPFERDMGRVYRRPAGRRMRGLRVGMV